MLNITPFTVIWCTTFYFISFPKWLWIVVVTFFKLMQWLLCLRQPKIVKCLCMNMRWGRNVTFSETLAQQQKYSRYLMCAPFFVVLISAIGSPHEAVNCGALLCQANTKYAINRAILCSALLCHNRAANKWLEKVNVIFTSNCIFTCYSRKLTYRYLDTFFADIFFFCRLLLKRHCHTLKSRMKCVLFWHLANSSPSLLAMVNNIILSKGKIRIATNTREMWN